MTDRNGNRIQAGDIVRVTGSYFSANDGVYAVLRVDEAVTLVNIEHSVLNEFGLPRADKMRTTNTGKMEVIGKVGTACA